MAFEKKPLKELNLNKETLLEMRKKERKEKDKNVKKKPGRKRVMYDFETAKDIVRGQCISSVAEYEVWWHRHRPNRVPKRPDRTYAKYGWKGWNDYLGNNNKFPKNGTIKNPLTYEEAKQYVQALKLGSMNNYLQKVRNGELTERIPNRPDLYYDKWVSWSEFLGSDVYDKIIKKVENNPYLYIFRPNDSIRTGVYFIGITQPSPVAIKEYCASKDLTVVEIYEYDNKGYDYKQLLKNMGAFSATDYDRADAYVIPNIFGVMEVLSIEFYTVEI